MRIRLKVMVVAALTVAMTAISAWAATPVKLVDTKADESSPTSADGWLAWSVWNRSAGRDIAWLDPSGPEDPRKVPTTASAYVGDIVLDGPRAGEAVFFQFEGKNGQIKFYDLATRDVLNAPSGINTSKSEEYPSASGDYLLFGRGPLGEDFVRQVLLYRFSTEKVTTVASSTQPFLIPDQVNGDYLVYTRKYDVYRRQISSGTTIRIPAAPDGRANYFGGVLPDGTAFFVQGSATTCGKNTKIMRLRNGNVSSIASVPDGYEIANLSAEEIGAETHIVFSRLSCKNLYGGIYEVVL